MDIDILAAAAGAKPKSKDPPPGPKPPNGPTMAELLKDKALKTIDNLDPRNNRTKVLGNIAIGHAWALPASISRDGQAFVPLVNEGKEADELVAARSSACGRWRSTSSTSRTR